MRRRYLRFLTHRAIAPTTRANGSMIGRRIEMESNMEWWLSTIVGFGGLGIMYVWSSWWLWREGLRWDACDRERIARGHRSRRMVLRQVQRICHGRRRRSL